MFGPPRSRDYNPIESRDIRGYSSILVVLTGALMLQSLGSLTIGHREPLLKSDGQIVDVTFGNRRQE